MILNEQSFIGQAVQSFKAAKHLYEVTYPVMKDHKLLLGVISSLFYALEAGVKDVLQSRNIQIAGNFRNNLNNFRSVTEQENVSAEQLDLIEQIEKLFTLHKRSLLTLNRGGRIVLLNKENQSVFIEPNDIGNYLKQCEMFLKTISRRKE